MRVVRLCCCLVAGPDRLLDRRIYQGALFTASAVGVSLGLLWMSWHLRRQTDWLDMRIYRNAINYWAHGHGLYTFQQPGTRNHLGFTYPPFGAMVLSPLAAMSLGQAELVFTVINVLLCVACGSGFGVALARRFGWPQWPSAMLGSAMVLSLEPVRESLGFGQINLVLLGLLAADMWLLSTGRRGGALIGLAAAIKLTPAVLILALFASGRRDAGRRALAASAGVTAVAAVVMPESSWQFWSREVWRTSRVGRPDRITNQSWTGDLARLGV
ncbi:MAG: putative rane protein, partial [Pseudonocardiales bacterium]|nr:putative rane protein [Pseudonocardiales bacterium]